MAVRGLLHLLLPVLAARALADVAVPRQGPVERGARADPRTKEVHFGEKTRPFRDYLLIETDGGALVWTPGLKERVEGYGRIVGEARRDELAGMVKEAVRARDPQTARRLYEWVKREGLSGKQERLLRRRVESAEDKGARVKRDRIQAVLEREQVLKKQLPDLLLARARVALEQGGRGGLELLRETLREDRRHKPSLRLLMARAKETPFGDARSWLDFHLDLESRGFLFMPKDPELKRAQLSWRPDLYAVGRKELMLLTPVRDMDVVRTVLLHGWIALRALQELFATDRPVARQKGPLVVRLYANSKNFSEHSKYGKNKIELPPWYEFPYGKFSWRDEVTRLLTPARRDRMGNLRHVVVHELTRHWLWSRNPRYSRTKILRAKRSAAAGFWAEAGLPLLFAEAEFDLAAGRLDLGHAGTKFAAQVRNRSGRVEEGLHSWKKVFLYSFLDINTMNGEVPPYADGLRPSSLFAMQGAAVCQYLLLAEKGKHRERLLDFVTHHYLADQARMAPRIAFAKSPLQLGRAVEDWLALRSAAGAKEGAKEGDG